MSSNKTILFIALCLSLIIACSESDPVIPEQTPTPIIKVVTATPTATPIIKIVRIASIFILSFLGKGLLRMHTLKLKQLN